ncbi:hypothetical protein JZ751_018550 [Albula glossodonta]|uniref:FH2 domain-containing protein n=1 Tax=Albula glossodonta TaxID=121402 RepID=A0A8T2NWI6_9TELE|nr:hypothetical protein JZ751_018550 [Albula glossodonta]
MSFPVLFLLYGAVCSTETERVCRDSSEDLLQPFKDKMEDFLREAKTELEAQEMQLTKTHKTFLELTVFFSVKAKMGEKEVSPNTFFSVWHEFSTDFKDSWKKENKVILQERLKAAEESFKQAREKASYNVKPKNASGMGFPESPTSTDMQRHCLTRWILRWRNGGCRSGQSSSTVSVVNLCGLQKAQDWKDSCSLRMWRGM